MKSILKIGLIAQNWEQHETVEVLLKTARKTNGKKSGSSAP
jgi:hypothetical protein